MRGAFDPYAAGCPMKILMVLNSHDPRGADALDAGVHLREFAVPYFVLRDAGAALTLAVRFDDRSERYCGHIDTIGQVVAARRFTQDAGATAALSGMRDFDALAAADFDAVFYAADHEARWEWRTEH